jgi:hypothetical protein
MKSWFALIWLLCATALILPASAGAAPRIALLESFTNTGCAPCASNNPIVHSFVEDAGTQVVLNVQYHVYWPSSTDPFYVANTTDNLGRRNYYAINAVPDLVTDGGNTPEPGSYDGLRIGVGNAAATPSPLELTVATSVVGTDMTVDVGVTALEDVPGTLMLRIALVEPQIYMDPPGADNGERDFYCTMREMLPSYTGQSFTISNGQTLNFSEVGAINAAWRDVYAVVWVQRDSDKAVLQAASSLPVPDYAFLYGAQEDFALTGFGLQSFPSTLQNRGAQSDTYDIHVDWDVPAGWGGGACIDEVCHQIGDDDFTLRMGPGEEEEITIDIEPVGSVGQGTAMVTVTSQADPSQTWSHAFRLITYGTPILCVDDDGGANYETYYEEALQASGNPYGIWDMASQGKADAALLSNFPIVIWNVGWAFPTLDDQDRAALTSYLDAGGRLFVSGQDIGWDMFDPSGSSYSPAAQAWYRTYLGATYVMDDTNLLTITGVAGDQIGDGLLFNIYGGTGANNQQYPSEIDPYGDGVGFLTYARDREAGVHLQTADFKTVYLAFGFEGIAEAADRALLMARILDFFDIDLVGVPGDTAPSAQLMGPIAAAPNPFNPRTTIRFEIGGQGQVPVTVDLYDLRGRLVRKLWQGPLAAGVQNLVWDGRNEAGGETASGVYLARVRVSRQESTVKLTLTR